MIRIAIILFLFFSCVINFASAQNSLHKDQYLQTFVSKASSNHIKLLSPDTTHPDKVRLTEPLSVFTNDSIWVAMAKEKYKQLLSLSVVDSGTVKRVKESINNLVQQSKPPLLIKTIKPETVRAAPPKKSIVPLAFNGGTIQYNLVYRSLIDTPFTQSNLVQQYISGNANVTVADKLPLVVTYIERESNSQYFKDFRDVTVNLNTPELQRLRTEEVRRQLTFRLRQAIREIDLPDIDSYRNQTHTLHNLLQNPQLITLLIQSKENIINLNRPDARSKWKDSAETYSKKIIEAYDEKEQLYKSWRQKTDSVQQIVTTTQGKITRLQNLLNGNLSSPETLTQLNKELEDAGIKDERIKGVSRFQSNVKRLAVGRTIPDLSDLSVKNINVKGLNFEYNDDKWYAAVTAGLVEFRIRDFNYGNFVNPKQYVFAAKAGIGQKNDTHIFITGYTGKKQLYFSNTLPSSAIRGTTLEVQYLLKRNHRLTAEIAQSSAPVALGSANSKFDLNDKTSRAWQVKWFSSLPKLKAWLDAGYQYTGLNFQSFNSYKTNAATTKWYMNYDQYFFHRQLHVKASLRTNDYENPLVQQNYSGNTVFKTLQATYKRKAWPSLTLGYIPSSQYSAINNQVYESRYQTWLANISHNYKIGKASAISNLSYTRFENSSSDSGFIYYNAKSLMYYQYLRFALHTATAFVNRSNNRDFNLTVFGASASGVFHKIVNVEVGFKINNLNNTDIKTGVTGKCFFNVDRIGDFAFLYDGGYLPGNRKQLVKNDQLSVSFTRYFK